MKKNLSKEIFEYGLRLAIDGHGYELIDRILTHLIELEPDKDKKLLKTIQKEAALEIQAGTGTKENVLNDIKFREI